MIRFVKIHPSDITALRIMWSPAKRGMYVSLIAHLQQHNSLPADDKNLAWIAGADIRTWRRHRDEILSRIEIFYVPEKYMGEEIEEVRSQQRWGYPGGM